jgi:hypothetical protein
MNEKSRKVLKHLLLAIEDLEPEAAIEAINEIAPIVLKDLARTQPTMSLAIGIGELESMKKKFERFLDVCIDSENFESNSILQDYITPELVEYIEVEVLKHKCTEVPA